MTQEEIKTLTDLNSKFDEDVKRVAEKLSEYDGDYSYVHNWSICGDTVFGEGDIYARGCFVDSVSVEFNIELLTYSDEELDNYVNNLIIEKEESERKKREEKEKRQYEKDLETFNQIKEKYNL